MMDFEIYTKVSELPLSMKTEVSDFIDFLLHKSKNKNKHSKKRIPGKAKGLIKMKANFDDPIEGFKDYM